jgi:hypothetical protein
VLGRLTSDVRIPGNDGAGGGKRICDRLSGSTSPCREAEDPKSGIVLVLPGGNGTDWRGGRLVELEACRDGQYDESGGKLSEEIEPRARLWIGGRVVELACWECRSLGAFNDVISVSGLTGVYA